MEFKLNDYHRNVSDEELLDDILKIAKKLGKTTLTRTEYKNNGGLYGTNTFIRHFGGWINALKMCGLIPDEKQTNPTLANYTKSYIETEELISDLQRVSSILRKKTFTSSEYAEYGLFSKSSMFKRFGTWNDALLTANLIPFEVPAGKRINEYDILNEIERIWILLGRQPTSTDIKNGISKYSLHVFERRFGSWRKALEFFVAYMNGEQEVEKPDDSAEEKLPYIPPRPTENKDDSHKTQRGIGLRTRFLIMKRDSFKCCICGRSPATTQGLELHVDHIIPWSKGGETTIDNLQTLCSDCNLGKSNLLEDDPF